ncbi:MAG: hypothetical protein E6J90_41855 [Deltaproteobacteria bacterium]|nr:MAG: hypothetical protein E6J91_40660 [Deltaproteobacteria bacterium]TMQ07973.1 MAG: hypothetical protein E6J90_41855 [Deltaproteobacteria bacterium]
MKRLGCIVLVMGCGFQSNGRDTPIDGNSPGLDAAADAGAADAMPDARVCFGSGLVQVCLARAPGPPITYSGTSSLDTSRAASCTQTAPQTGGPELCVIAATSITVGGTLTVTGTRPLVLIGADSVSVLGTLDLSSTTSTTPRRTGAGGNPGQPLCVNPAAPENDNGGAGGGAGASLGTKGGDGGTGDLNNSGTPANGSARGGVASAALGAPALLRGGCRGGNGGDADAQHRGGAGGDGGGAVYLIAGNTITVSGDVFASGAGGDTTPNTGGAEQGGGGGGTGGMIGLDAPTVSVSGHVVANGGGGGGGGALNGGTAGGDGTTASWNTRAASGSPGTGGTGSVAAGAPGTAIKLVDMLKGGDADAGGGGGGGGLGIIWIDGKLDSAVMMISPAPAPH